MMNRILAVVAAVAAAGGATMSAQGGAGVVGQYGGYAYADCTAAKRDAVRIVLMTGPVPAAMPAKPPRPSLELLVYAPVDKAAGQTFTVSRAADAAGAALTCPVVGECSQANTGTITLDKRGADGGLSGTYNAAWGNGAPRNGKFNVQWRDGGKACS
jgi:hypothetical protein